MQASSGRSWVRTSPGVNVGLTGSVGTPGSSATAASETSDASNAVVASHAHPRGPIA